MAAFFRLAVATGLALAFLLPPEKLCAAEFFPDNGAALACAIDPIPIGVARPATAFQTSAALLYLQPSGYLAYATVTHPFPFPSPYWENLAIDPDFHPAFNVGLRYDFDGGGDVRLDWTHLNSNDRESAQSANPYVLNTVNGPASTAALGPPFLIGPPLPYAFVHSVAHFAYDAVNLDAGVSLSIGSHVQLRAFAGIQFARISEHLTTRFDSVVNSLTFIDDTRSLFTGAGPRLGMELHYVTGKLDLLGGIGGAAVIGSQQSHIDFLTVSPTNTAMGLIPNAQSLTSPTSTHVIPCIDARLGASYTVPVCGWGLFRCEVGYQTAVYVNAIRHYVLTEVLDTDTESTEGIDTTFLRTSAETRSDFLVHGPYVRFSIHF